MPLTVIICGGGIGGLSAAGFLRAKHKVMVLERGEISLGPDYGLSIASNAFNLLQKANLSFDNLDNVVLTHIWERDHKNDEVNTIPFDTRSKYGGAPSVLARRSKILAELLHFATSPDFPGTPAEIIQNATVARVDAARGKVWTKDGRVFEGDLVIGADGINSVCRSAVFEGQKVPSPVTHDIMTFMTTVPIEAIKAEPDLAFLAEPEKQAGLVSYSSADPNHPEKRVLLMHLSPREVQVFGRTREKEFSQQFDQERTAILRDIPAARVAEEYEGEFPESLVNLFKHKRIDAWRIRDLSPIDTWFSGRTILIGDAAHAVTPHAGQGSNITIEDAEALAYLLRGAEPSTDLRPVFEKFVSLRVDRVQLVQRRSREIGNLLTEEQKKLGPIGIEAFSKVIHSYQGIESVLESSKA